MTSTTIIPGVTRVSKLLVNEPVEGHTGESSTQPFSCLCDCGETAVRARNSLQRAIRLDKFTACDKCLRQFRWELAQHRRDRVTLTCRNCSVGFEVERGKAGKTKYCSLECAIEKRGEDQRGNKFGANNAKNLTGKRSGKLVGVKPTGRRHNNHIVWLFDCDCGGTIEMTAGAFLEKERRGKGRDACFDCLPPGRWGGHVSSESDQRERRRRRDAAKRRQGHAAKPRRTSERAPAERKPAERAPEVQPTFVRGSYVVDGKPMGVVTNERTLKWLESMFPGGVVIDGIDSSAPRVLASASVTPPTSGATP